MGFSFFFFLFGFINANVGVGPFFFVCAVNNVEGDF